MPEKFQTKFGYCHIKDGEIVLSNSTDINDVSADKSIKRLYFKKVLALVMALGQAAIFLFLIDYSYQRNAWHFMIAFVPAFAFFSFLTGYIILTFFLDWNNSAASRIKLERITKIKFQKEKNFFNHFSNPYFAVYFLDENDKIKKRLIILPPATDYQEEIDQARKIMKKIRR